MCPSNQTTKLIQAILYFSINKTHRRGIGLTEDEIHAIIFRLHRETDGKLGSNITFTAGIQSTEIESVLTELTDQGYRSWFSDDPSPIPVPGGYYSLPDYETTRQAKEFFEQLPPHHSSLIEKTVDQAIETPQTFIQRQTINSETKNQPPLSVSTSPP